MELEPLKDLTLKSLLRRSAEVFAQRPALSFADGEPITFATLYKRAQETSVYLQDHGVSSGDRVAILSENMPNWGIAFFAITTMGSVVVPILPEFHPNEIHHILRHSACKALFVSERLCGKIEEGQLDTLTTIIRINDFCLLSSAPKQDKFKEVVTEEGREFARLKEAQVSKTGKISADVTEGDLASIIYTSGTTGKSKGVMLTHKNLVSNALSATKIISYIDKGEERFLSVLPLSHTYECTVGFIVPLMWGCSIYYLDKPPTARVLLPAMQKVRPTMMLSVPLIIEKIYKMRILPQLTRSALMRKLYSIGMIRSRLHKIAGKKLHTMLGGKLHFFGIGGAPLSPDVETFLRNAGFPYAVGYGLTETSPLIAGSNAKHTKYRATGPAITDVEIKIDNPNPETGEGEILARGPNVMQGYYKAPELTDEVLSEDGWFRTGDLGALDKDGYLYIKGRLKNMILGPSGENIYPEEIEAIICEHGSVLEAIVYKRHDNLVARIHLNYDKLDEEFNGQKLSESQIQERIKTLLEDLRKDVNRRVSSFSRLNRIIEQSEPFEKTPTKKIKRYLYVD